MGRSAKSFDRSSSRFKPQPQVLVVCEDSKSGKKYLEDASAYFRVSVKVEIVHCGYTDPRGIVEYAISRQAKFDKIFCVIDRDTHENFEEALVLSRCSDKISVISSYPCFEFWYLLHFGKCTKPYSRSGNDSPGACLIKDLRAQAGMEDYDKGSRVSLFDMLLERLPVARRVSPQVLADAYNVGNLNPSTAVHLLIDEFEVLSKPQLA